MMRYVIMINYGSYEGWKIEDQTNDHDTAISIYMQALSLGSGEVKIFSPVKVNVKLSDFED